jgi:hypothetical protein
VVVRRRKLRKRKVTRQEVEDAAQEGFKKFSKKVPMETMVMVKTQAEVEEAFNALGLDKAAYGSKEYNGKLDEYKGRHVILPLATLMDKDCDKYIDMYIQTMPKNTMSTQNT